MSGNNGSAVAPAGNTATLLSELSHTSFNAMNALSDLIGAIADIAGAAGAVVAVVGIIQSLLGQASEAQQTVEAIESEFRVLFETEQAGDAVTLMRDVSDKMGLIRAALSDLRHLMPTMSPSDPVRAQILADSETVVQTLGDQAYWLRPYIPQGAYAGTNGDTGGTIWPPPLTTVAGSSLVFDYRLTMPAYIEAISDWLIIRAALVPNYLKVYQDELAAIASKLQGYHDTIVGGIVTYGCPLVIKDAGDGKGRQSSIVAWAKDLGAVNLYTAFAAVDPWPARLSSPYSDDIVHDLQYDSPTDKADYAAKMETFVLLFSTGTMARWKRVYADAGLPQLRHVIDSMRALAGLPLLPREPDLDWSLRAIVAANDAALDIALPAANQISLKAVLAKPGQGFKSLRQAVSAV